MKFEVDTDKMPSVRERWKKSRKFQIASALDDLLYYSHTTSEEESTFRKGWVAFRPVVDDRLGDGKEERTVDLLREIRELLFEEAFYESIV